MSTDASPAAPLLRARGLTARMGGTTLFTGLDLEVFPGELVAVTGPNGSGKSTLLKILLGLLRPVAGTVERRSDVATGYVPQLDPGDPGHPFPAVAVVEQGLPRLRWSPGAARASRTAAVEALKRAGFLPPPSRRYTVLSGGERRRVLLARALAGRPRFLALDEPTAGVDVEGEREVERLVLEEVKDRGAGAIWICHGLSTVEHMATRTLRLGLAS